MTDLASSIARLKDFRATWNDDDVIDEESGLSGADLDTIIRVADGLVEVRQIDLNDPRAIEALRRE